MLIFYDLFLIGLEKSVGKVLTHRFVDLHVPLEMFFLGRTPHLVVSSRFIHHIKSGGVAQIGVVKLFEYVLAGTPEHRLTEGFLLRGHREMTSRFSLIGLLFRVTRRIVLRFFCVFFLDA
jgi:hypothetical protein